MYFFAFDKGIFSLVQQAYRSQCPISLDYKQIFKIRGISEPDVLLRKTAVNLIFDLVNGYHAVGRDLPLHFEKETVVDLFICKTVKETRL